MNPTLTFRAETDLIEQARSLAAMLGLKQSDYIRDALKEKNERVMAERIAMLSRSLSSKHSAINAELEGTISDGL